MSTCYVYCDRHICRFGVGWGTNYRCMENNGTQINDLVNRTRCLAIKVAFTKNIQLALRELQRETYKAAIEFVAKTAAKELGYRIMTKPLLQPHQHNLDEHANTNRKARYPVTIWMIKVVNMMIGH